MIKTKRELTEYLDAMIFVCEEPVSSSLTYVYLQYATDYTHYLRITVKDCTTNTIRIVGSGLLHLEQTQPDMGNGEAYLQVLRGLTKCMDMLGVRIIDMQPVHYCEMLECSGLLITELTNEIGYFAPHLEVYSGGKVVFNNHIQWLFLSAKDIEDGQDD